ncbi:hypothetical protein OFN71_34455, partial [Escherichia coli]|nr:hypothetical protein [Escherichia coli]
EQGFSKKVRLSCPKSPSAKEQVNECNAIFSELVNGENERRYDKFNFAFLPLDLAILLRLSSCQLTPC